MSGRFAGARDGVLLLHETPHVVPEGFVFLLCDMIKIPLNPRFHERPLVVVDELGTEISPGIDRIRWKSREPILYGWRQDDGEVIRHGVLVTPDRFGHRCVDPKPRLWVPVSIVGLDAFRAETVQPFGSAKLGRKGPDAIDADPFAFTLAWGRRSGWRASVASVVAGWSVVVDAEALAFVIAPAVLILFLLASAPVDDVASVVVVVYGAASICHVALASLYPLPAT